MVRNVDTGNSLRESVATDSNRAQRGKLFEGKFHHCVSSKSKKQIPNKLQIIKSQRIRQARRLPNNSQRTTPVWNLGFKNCLGFGMWNLGFTWKMKFGFFRSRSAARYRHSVLAFLPRPHHCQCNRSSFSWRAA